MSEMVAGRRRVWLLGLSVLTLVVLGVGVFLVTNQGSVVGRPDIPAQYAVGPPWTNAKTRQSGGPDYVTMEIPFESTGGCGGDTFTRSISWLQGRYLQNPTLRGGHDGSYLGATSLPDQAVFTGWEREGERLWIVRSDKAGPGEYRYLYVEKPEAVERWPRATFGCA